MKRCLAIVLLVCLFCVLVAGCSKQENPDTGSNLGQGTQAQDKSAANNGIDVDLTTLSSTMVFAEVNNMMINPHNYIGKTVKASGTYYASYYEETGKYYHYVLVEDATACCSKGLEFVWSGNHTYPDDYPQNFTVVEIIGVFGVYEELGESYTYLTVEAVTVLG